MNWRRLGFVTLTALTLLSFAPLIGLLLSGGLASILNCQLDEGSIHPCLVWGQDIGDLLNGGFVLGWLMLATWPGVLLTTAIWLALLIRRWFRPKSSS